MKVGLGLGFGSRVERESSETRSSGRAQKNDKSDTRNITNRELDEAAPLIDTASDVSEQIDFDTDPFVLKALRAPRALQYDPKDLDTRPMSAEDMLTVLRDYERMLRKS